MHLPFSIVCLMPAEWERVRRRGYLMETLPMIQRSLPAPISSSIGPQPPRFTDLACLSSAFARCRRDRAPLAVPPWIDPVLSRPRSQKDRRIAFLTDIFRSIADAQECRFGAVSAITPSKDIPCRQIASSESGLGASRVSPVLVSVGAPLSTYAHMTNLVF